MSQFDRGIQVVIEADLDAYIRQLETAEAESEKAAEAIDIQTKKVESSFDKMAAGVSRRIIGVTGVIMVLQSSLRELEQQIENAVVGVEGFERNWAESTQEVLKQIPIVGKIGHMISLMSPEYRQQLQEQKEITEQMEQQAQIAERAAGREREASRVVSDLAEAHRALQRAKAGEDERDEVARQQELQQAREEFERRESELLARGGRGGEALVELERERLRVRLETINHEYDERARLHEERMAEEAERIALAAEDQAEREARDAERRRAREEAEAEREANVIRQRRMRMADIESEIRQIELQSQGMHLEAQIEQLERHYDRRIEMAADAAEREALERLKAMRLAQLGSEPEGRMRGVGMGFQTALGQFTTGRAPGEKPAGRDLQERELEQTKKIATATQDTVKELRRLSIGFN